MLNEEQDKAEFTEGELVFRTDIKGEPKWQSVPSFIGYGILLGQAGSEIDKKPVNINQQTN